MESIWWKQLWPCTKFHPRTNLEELWKTMKNLRQIVCVTADSWTGHLLNTSQKCYYFSQFPHFLPKFFVPSTQQFIIAPSVRPQPGYLSLDWLMHKKLQRCECLPAWCNIQFTKRQITLDCLILMPANHF